MTMHVQTLKDTEGVDHGPFMEFCQWAREHDNGICFGAHYDWPDGQATIMDLGTLHDELKEYFEGIGYDRIDPPPPDIRGWLRSQIDMGHVLAYVSW